MKLTSQMLRSRGNGPLHSIELIDLSKLNFGGFDRISACPKLQSVNLSYNEILYVSCLEDCPELWKIDLHNNKLCNLEGLSRFVALGTLILCNNDLTWSELSKIRHMHILNLSLHGNPQLEKDPYYRIHVIDCLPNVWMLDGRIITSAERTQVENFFKESAMTERPVRHKLGKEQFVPSFRKKLDVTGVFGKRTDHLMRRFPRNCALNIENDHRRILYLAYDLQQNLLVESKYMNNRNWSAVTHNNNCLEDVLEMRGDDRVRCNMLLLLLVASLEFAIPSHLMQEALRCTKLDAVGDVEIMELFLLPKEVRCHIVSLLLSSVKVDKDAGEDGGLYDKLYLCLYHSVSELNRISQGGKRHTPNKHTIASEKTNKCLIASEVVQLLCIVPAFFDYITKDNGVMNLVTMATSDLQFVDRIDKLMAKMEKNQWELKRIYENVAEVTLRAIQENMPSLVVKKPKIEDNYVLNTGKVATKRPQSSPIFASHYHMIGRTSPDKKPVRIKSGKPYRGSYIPQAQLGEKVLLGPQNVARVISIPEPELVLVQMDIVPDESGAMISNRKTPEEHYKYIDMKNLYWDYMGRFWRPNGTIGDRITLQSKDDREQEELITQAQKLATKDSLTDVIKSHSPRVPNVAEEPPLKNKVEIPRAVSAKYKENHKLKLELDDGQSSFPEKTIDDQEVENHVPPPSRAKSARPASQSYDNPYTEGMFTYHQVQNALGMILSNTHRKANGAAQTQPTLSIKGDDDEDELLYVRSQLSHNSPRSSLESFDEPELKTFEDSQPNTRPGTGTASRKESRQAAVTSPSQIVDRQPIVPSPECAIEIPQVDVDSQVTTARSGSDVSSPKKIVHDGSSRPDVIPENENMSLQGSGDGTQQTVNSVTRMEDEEDHDKQEVDSQQYSTTSIDNENPSSSDVMTDAVQQRIEPSDIEAVYGSSDVQESILLSSRSITTHNIDVFTVEGSKHNKAYKNGSYHMPRPSSGYEQYVHTKVQFNKRPSTAHHYNSEESPLQRPPSPFLHRAGKKSNITVQHGQTWLGGGRDLHWEKKVIRPKSGHTPGWKEGLPSRPKSAAAIRALKRSKTPNIVTPSSMAFDDIYGRNVINLSRSDLTQYQVQHDFVSSSPKYGSYNYQSSGPRRLGVTPTPANSRPATPQNSYCDV